MKEGDISYGIGYSYALDCALAGFQGSGRSKVNKRAKAPKRAPRRFEVYLDKNIAGSEPDIEIIEMPADVTDVEYEEACRDCLETMISNVLDTGWHEIKPEEKIEENK